MHRFVHSFGDQFFPGILGTLRVGSLHPVPDIGNEKISLGDERRHFTGMVVVEEIVSAVQFAFGFAPIILVVFRPSIDARQFGGPLPDGFHRRNSQPLGVLNDFRGRRFHADNFTRESTCGEQKDGRRRGRMLTIPPSCPWFSPRNLLIKMKEIKLSGRERTVLRAIDFSTGTIGEELLDRTHLAPDDLVDVLNGLMTVGYAEMRPYGEMTSLETFRETHFDVNPSYALQLREALVR